MICIIDPQNHAFRHISILVAMSIVQGGPGFPTLAPHIYKYITSGDYLNLSIPSEEFPDSEVRHLLVQVIYLLRKAHFFQAIAGCDAPLCTIIFNSL